MKKLAAILVLGFALTMPAWAAIQTPRTVTLFVPGMDCFAWPPDIETALAQLVGVENVDVRFKEREVVVTFDDTKTTAEALIEAVESAGYPSFII